MSGEAGWRNLSQDNQHRAPERDIEITDITCTVIEANFPWNIITVETDHGVVGFGEAFPGPIQDHVEYLKPKMIGENPLDVDRLVEFMTERVSPLGGSLGYSQAAVSGIEIALWDIAGKVLDLPVYQLLGGKYRDSVQIYADCHAGEALNTASSISDADIYAPDAYAEVARNVIDEGFSALKFDLDVKIEEVDPAPRRLSNREIEHKREIVEAVREEIGYEPTLGFDLHWNFSVETAIKLANKIEEYEVNWLEDVVPPENPETQKKVTENTAVPILAGENLTRVEGFLPFLVDQTVDYLAPDIQKCGGLLEFRKIAAVADAYNIPMAPHNISSPIGTMASVHACSTVANSFALEWHAREVEWWNDFYVDNSPLIQDGEIQVPEEPGLGLEVDIDVLNEHLAPGEEKIDV